MRTTRSPEPRRRGTAGRLAVLAFALTAALAFGAPAQAAPLPGAIFTTDAGCGGVDLNIYAAKGDVYLNGGPSHPGAANLPPGAYYVQVTQPDGTLLGTSVGAADPTPFTVSGNTVKCIRLSDVLIKAGDNSPGYDDTGNPGGEYKVWVSTDPVFPNNSTKTDAFKVKGGETNPPPTAKLHVLKYYDHNANGVKDAGEAYLAGWRFEIADGIDFFRETPVDMTVDPDTYTITEQQPVEANWFNSDPGLPAFKTLTLAAGEDKTAEFGNYCTKPSGGLSMGFWSNKNGQALITAGDLSALTALHLVGGAGGAFDPGTAAQVKSFIQAASATNMANMLSSQLAAMKLNRLHGYVDPQAFVLGFKGTIAELIQAADDALAAHPVTVTAGANRTAEEQLKNHLDALNNNGPVVPTTACTFTFAE